MRVNCPKVIWCLMNGAFHCIICLIMLSFYHFNLYGLHHPLEPVALLGLTDFVSWCLGLAFFDG